MSFNLAPISPVDRRKLIRRANWIIIGVGILLATILFFSVGFNRFPSGFVLIEVGCAGNLLYLKYGGSLDRAGAVFIGLLLLALGLGGFNTYGFHGSLLLMSPLIPIFALLLLNAKSAIVSVALTLLVLFCLFILEATGFVPENPNQGQLVTFGRFLILSTLCLISTWGLWCYTNYSKQLLERIEKQSITDFLTGILNRRGIEQMLAHEYSGAKRKNTPLSLIVIDIDFFKRYNDNNGHQAGDECLIEIAQIITSCVARNTDLVGRFGGEEFVIILPDTSADGACVLAEKIRAGIADKAIPYKPGGEAFVTVTVGVATDMGGNLGIPDALFRKADNALYQGKRDGRNRVVCSSMVENGEAPAVEEQINSVA